MNLQEFELKTKRELNTLGIRRIKQIKAEEVLTGRAFKIDFVAAKKSFSIVFDKRFQNWILQNHINALIVSDRKIDSLIDWLRQNADNGRVKWKNIPQIKQLPYQKIQIIGFEQLFDETEEALEYLFQKVDAFENGGWKGDTKEEFWFYHAGQAKVAKWNRIAANRKFQKWLHQRMKEMNMNHIELAQALRVFSSTTYKWTNEGSLPNPILWNRLAELVAAKTGRMLTDLLYEMFFLIR